MKAIVTIFMAAIIFVSARAHTYTYTFSNTPISEAIVRISNDHPEVNISFIYRELDKYRISAKIMTDDVYEALRRTIGLNPISVIKKDGNFYIEAFQHGKYCYSGRVESKEGDPVMAATVMLLAPKDSTVITYGITDHAGRFSIPCDREGVIAKISCIGYLPTYKTSQSFAIGTIIINEMPIQLRTVNVEAGNTLFHTDKNVYRPTQRQKDASQTAIDLLRYLSIPQISINLVDESVTTLTGGMIALYVNGLPASAEELQGIRTEDIKVVEYLDFPSNPRYDGNEHVINFVVQKYEYGGYTKLSVNENVLAGLSNRISVYSKFTYRKMTYDFYAGSANHDIRHSGTSRIEKYKLTGMENANIVTREEIFDDSHFKYNQYPITLRCVYDSDNAQIGNTIGFNFDQGPEAKTQGHLSFSPNTGKDYAYINTQPYTSRHLIWTGAYYFVLPNEIQLSFSPRANYGHTNYLYNYLTTLPDSKPINNSSRESYYNISGGIMVYKIFSNKHNTSVYGYGGTNRNRVSYTGTSPFDNNFSDSYAGLRGGYQFNNRRCRFDANVAMQWERNGINGNYISEIYPLVNLSAQYTPTNSQSLQCFFHYGANYPGESVKTPNILQENELMYKTGNPNLSLSRQITLNTQYNYTANTMFSMAVYGQYFGEYNLYVPVFESYKDGTAILKTYSSNQNYNRTQMGMSFNLKLFGGAVQLASQPSISIFRYNGIYNMTKSPLTINGSLTYYVSRFFLQASYQSAQRTIQGNYAMWYKTRDFYQLQAGWSNSNWNIRLSAINFLRGDWLAATQILEAPLYSGTIIQGGTYYHRRINISLTYTFGYGKKVQRGNEVGEQSGGSSAILR